LEGAKDVDGAEVRTALTEDAEVSTALTEDAEVSTALTEDAEGAEGRATFRITPG